MIRITFLSKAVDGKVLLEINPSKKLFDESSKVYTKVKAFLKDTAKKPARLMVEMEEKKIF